MGIKRVFPSRLTAVRWRECLMIGMALLVLCLSADQAMAHARLVRSSPADGATLSSGPARIEIWFNELLEDNFNVVRVFPEEPATGRSRTNLAQGKPVLDPQDRTHLTVRLQPLRPGRYVVEFRVLSKDGHSAPGKISFRVHPAG